MIKFLTVILFFGLSSTFYAQEVQEQDSLQAPVLLQNKTPKKKKGSLMSFDSGPAKEINPLAPARAAFLSAVLPGLGQFYNKKYWKVPLVYAAIGGSAYVFKVNDNLYRRYRDAFKSRRAGFMNDEFYDVNESGIVPGSPDLSDKALQDGQERYQKDRDLYLVVTIGLYALNIIDANVNAHLKQFNVNDQLSVEYKPFLDLEPITNTTYFGMGMTITY